MSSTLTWPSNAIVDTYANRPASASIGRMFAPTDGGYSSLWDGTNWRPYFGNVLCTAPPSTSVLSTAVNSGSGSNAHDLLSLSSASVGTQLVGIVGSISSGTSFSIEVGSVPINPAGGQVGFVGGGPIVLDNVSGKLVALVIGMLWNSGNDISNIVSSGYWGSATSRTSHTDGIAAFHGPVFGRIVGGSSTITFQLSANRVNWYTFGSTVSYSTAFGGNNPTHYGVGMQPEGATKLDVFHMVLG